MSVLVTQEDPVTAISDQNNIFFPLNSATVGDMERQKLRRHADRLKLNHDEIATLKGYTDNQGSRSYNLAITEERINAVRKMLRSYGVSKRQIRRNRSGGMKGGDQCVTNECRQKMRRVELLYSP